MDKYILDKEGNPVHCNDLARWGAFMKAGARRVARWEHGDWLVSTAFLGVDHRLDGEGDPLLYETTIFHDGLEANQEGVGSTCEHRCTRDEALDCHEAAVKRVKEFKGADNE